ncbi:hypothetical protein CGLO_13385 [Colletotrichum gloeosporioides Cg-14]|uniref:Uncharacterized protein n=1 Tax=Colletotrichum gloeosporioides (strain Cg-14) TaxID=1237896 RepID=T0L7B0_COLGC|nr:hypothetical protein CGLO_13385 [Colletotrichum gloeosporioides Cg-14]
MQAAGNSFWDFSIMDSFCTAKSACFSELLKG